MDRRLLGNILISILFILLGSGLLLYFTPFEKRIASMHTFFALLFIFAIVFHIINNKLPLTNYIKGKRLSKLKKIQAPLILLFFSLVCVVIYLEDPMFNAIYNWGNQFRNKQLGKIDKVFDYQIIEMDKTFGNHKVSIELKKGESFQYPLFAVWAEDSTGNYIKTLYISRVISSSTFDYGEKVDDGWKPATLRRPEALPYWSHKRGVQAPDGLFVPLGKSSDLDAVSGATPTSNFIIKSKTDLEKNTNYKILIEINQSYDWNEYYTEDRFPDDEIYSGTGQVGQPSLIYAAEIKKSELEITTHKIMRLIGHGHYSGEDGKLYEDVSQITTAKSIADRIVLTLEQTL